MKPGSFQRPELGINDVHIWTVDEKVQTEALLRQFVLADDEKERAAKFRFTKDRNTFLTGRIVMRFLLGRYLQQNPSDLVFAYNDQDKPYLSSSTIDFNLSNTRSSIALGITKNVPIGIDIEYNKRPIEIEQIAANFFSKNEVDKLLGLPEVERLSAFYNCWTRKEAFIKAKGGGLTIPLDQFEVAFLPYEKPRLLNIAWDKRKASKWGMYHFSMGQDYTGAAIVENNASDFKQIAFQKVWLEEVDPIKAC